MTMLMVSIAVGTCEDEFEAFVRKYDKHYESPEEEERRRHIFCDRLAWIKKRNRQLAAFKRLPGNSIMLWLRSQISSTPMGLNPKPTTFPKQSASKNARP
ncbi:Ank2 [Symbiodinium sp. KB8]|nr:Ank2 [Symbiodinium sp. KB8]